MLKCINENLENLKVKNNNKKKSKKKKKKILYFTPVHKGIIYFPHNFEFSNWKMKRS